MRILFHHRIASRDGQAVHIEELIAALERDGHETLLVGPKGLMAAGFGSSNPIVDGVKRWIPAVLYELLEIAYSARAFLRLRAAVRTYRPDVVYERFSLFLFAGIWMRQFSEVPILLEVNSPLYEERMKNDGLRLHRFGRWAQRLLWRRVDHVLPVTDVLARTVAEYGVPPSRITVIPNGINPDRFGAVPDTESAKAALGLPPRLVLGFTGFVRGWNAVHRLIDFVAEHHTKHDLHVLIVGDGPAREDLIRHAEMRGVADRLTITGIVERDDVARYVAAFDIAMLPGITPYSSPLKLFEYLQLGRVIVGPDSENIREIVTHGHDALLFDPDREGALEETLLRLCTDPALRTRLGQQAPKTIVEKSLTWGRNAERVVAIAEAAIRQNRRPAAADAEPSGSRG
ncbi:MAG TPA: glycosyltransferase family 4 protein [Aliidongia sp.]|uniref:glycosyltransferase family 4 protein n=1 Tax=Aliidongia sp. TaxID=1914230 RepID=UPI002DDD64A3|nr:glycosyltransferase family 4 protein [Aliidongia sp.]HEV2673685.1 glycosyltransferase family 4 protein [Aliidongia sp.]